MKKPIQRRDWLVSAIGGLALGMASAAALMPDGVLELFRRLGHSGGGESADWGEPAFYLSIVAVPVALVSSVIVFFAYRALRKP